MKSLIYYYTGTGNSLWVAREVQKKLIDAQLESVHAQFNKNTFQEADLIAFVFPVHIWGVPRAVLNFIEKLPDLKSKKIFAYAVNAGQVSRTLIQLDEVLKEKGSRLSYGFSLAMPSNYIPWGGPCDNSAQMDLFAEAKFSVSKNLRLVTEEKPGGIEKGPLWQRLLFTLIYKISYKHVPTMDKKFFADERCNACGICSKVCPVNNIVINDKPIWQNHCEQCLACIQWCPQECLQYGDKTKNYKRYHHPEITLKDMIQN